MKIICYLTLYLLSISLYGQHSGTFKVAKKKYDEKLVKAKKNLNFYIATEGTIRRKKGRDTDILFGFNFIKHPIFIGVKGGKADLRKKYDGLTLGAFLVYEPYWSHFLGRWKGTIPIEISYEKLINKLDSPNLNQYSLGAGLSFNLPSFSQVRIGFLANYIIHTNSITTFKGFYPTIRVSYIF